MRQELVRIMSNVATGYRSPPSPLFAGQPARDNKDGRK